MFCHVQTALVVSIFALTIADNPNDQFNYHWKKVEEAELSGIHIDELTDKYSPVKSDFEYSEEEYKIFLTLPDVSAKDIQVNYDGASRSVKVTAFSFKYLPRTLYYYSEVIPAGFSTDGEWRFTPVDTLTIVFPKDGTRRSLDRQASTLQRSSGVGVLAEDPGILVKWRKSQYHSESISYGGKKDEGLVVEAHPSSVEVKKTAAAPKSACATMALLFACISYPILKYFV